MKIHTSNGAVERVKKEQYKHLNGEYYTIGTAHINGHKLPRLMYSPSSKVISSVGSHNRRVNIERDEEFGIYTIELEGIDWNFGIDAEATAKQKIQNERARALILAVEQGAT